MNTPAASPTQKLACVVLKANAAINSTTMLLIAQRAQRGKIQLALSSNEIRWRCEDGVTEELLLPEDLCETVLCRIRAEGVYVFELQDLLSFGYDCKPIALLQMA